MNEVSRILDQIGQGEPTAAERLLPLVYDELRKLAAVRLAQEKPNQTLQATALVHEAYVRLVGKAPDQRWDHRGHFFAAAAEAMRRILIEQARRKQRVRHGGGMQRIDLNEIAVADSTPPNDLLAIDEALADLAKLDPVKSRLVELRFFAGLSVEDAASCLGISRATAVRYWTFARAWLYEKVCAIQKSEKS